MHFVPVIALLNLLHDRRIWPEVQHLVLILLHT